MIYRSEGVGVVMGEMKAGKEREGTEGRGLKGDRG